MQQSHCAHEQLSLWKVSGLPKTDGAEIQARICLILSAIAHCLLRHRIGSLMTLEDMIDGCEGTEGAPIWLNNSHEMFFYVEPGQSVKVFRGCRRALPSTLF